MWQTLESADRWLFKLINSGLTNDAFDYIMPYLRNSNYWLPLYLFLLLFITLNFGKKGWWWCLFFICVVSLSDIFSSRFFKYYFERIRPCNEIDMIDQVRLLVRCPGGYSFTSSHATNHFGMAAFFFFTFRHFLKHWAWLPFVWAFFVVYAQIYVGVHYPLDIIGGGILGASIAWVLASIFNKRFGLINFDNQQKS